MKDYFHWSFKQLYLFFFLPTQFRQEIEGVQTTQLRPLSWKRYHYVLKMVPWIIALAVIENLIFGYCMQALGLVFNWKASLVCLLIGVPIGIILGGTLGLRVSLGGGVAIGVIGGLAGGVAVGGTMGIAVGMLVGMIAGVGTIGVARVVGHLNKSITGGIWMGMSAAIALAAGVIVSTTVTSQVRMSVAAGIAFGVASGITAGMSSGVEIDVEFGALFGFTVGLVLGVAGGIAAGITFAITFGAPVGLVTGIAFLATFSLVQWLTYFRIITYPFDVVLSTVAYMVGRRGPHLTARAWQWCPVVWNEVIWLPLPLVNKFLLLLVRQNREYGFSHIAFVAADRPLQRRAALAALVEVAVDDLKVCSLLELSTVTERLNWTTDASTKLPAELITTLSRLDRIAQHVGQYFTLHSSYRKSVALDRAVGEVESLQRSLITARGRLTSQLLQVVNEWRMLLDSELEIIKALAKSAHEIPNPFVFGNPVTETEHNVFTGRSDIIRLIEASVLGSIQPPTLLLHGPRRMGKTSILNQLPRLLGPDFAPAIIDCQNSAVIESKARLLHYLSRALSSGLMRRHIGLSPLTASALEHEPFAVFDEWLELVEHMLPEGMRILLCLDEYERLQATIAAGWGDSFLDTLRHIIQHRPRMVLMFTGAHTFQELGPSWTDRFISARRVQVSFLTTEEVTPLLINPVPEFDMTYAPGSIEVIIDATNCQPFLTQAVAFELVQFLNEQQRREVTPDDVEKAIARALVSGGEYFANVWSDAGEQGQMILSSIAREELPPDFPAAREWLRDHDVLNSDGNFAVKMMKQWVKEKFVRNMSSRT
jgi:uncharacterized protein